MFGDNIRHKFIIFSMLQNAHKKCSLSSSIAMPGNELSELPYQHIRIYLFFSSQNNIVDAKINTLKSERKCLPSSGKSTKRASQFNL